MPFAFSTEVQNLHLNVQQCLLEVNGQHNLVYLYLEEKHV